MSNTVAVMETDTKSRDVGNLSNTDIMEREENNNDAFVDDFERENSEKRLQPCCPCMENVSEKQSTEGDSFPTETNENSMHLCLNSISMPRNWSQIERLKIQRNKLRESLLNVKIQSKKEEILLARGPIFEREDNVLDSQKNLETNNVADHSEKTEDIDCDSDSDGDSVDQLVIDDDGVDDNTHTQLAISQENSETPESNQTSSNETQNLTGARLSQSDCTDSLRIEDFDLCELRVSNINNSLFKAIAGTDLKASKDVDRGYRKIKIQTNLYDKDSSKTSMNSKLTNEQNISSDKPIPKQQELDEKKPDQRPNELNRSVSDSQITTEEAQKRKAVMKQKLTHFLKSKTKQDLLEKFFIRKMKRGADAHSNHVVRPVRTLSMDSVIESETFSKKQNDTNLSNETESTEDQDKIVKSNNETLLSSINKSTSKYQQKLLKELELLNIQKDVTLMKTKILEKETMCNYLKALEMRCQHQKRDANHSKQDNVRNLFTRINSSYNSVGNPQRIEKENMTKPVIGNAPIKDCGKECDRNVEDKQTKTKDISTLSLTTSQDMEESLMRKSVQPGDDVSQTVETIREDCKETNSKGFHYQPNISDKSKPLPIEGSVKIEAVTLSQKSPNIVTDFQNSKLSEGQQDICRIKGVTSQPMYSLMNKNYEPIYKVSNVSTSNIHPGRSVAYIGQRVIGPFMHPGQMKVESAKHLSSLVSPGKTTFLSPIQTHQSLVRLKKALSPVLSTVEGTSVLQVLSPVQTKTPQRVVTLQPVSPVLSTAQTPQGFMTLKAVSPVFSTARNTTVLQTLLPVVTNSQKRGTVQVTTSAASTLRSMAKYEVLSAGAISTRSLNTAQVSSSAITVSKRPATPQESSSSSAACVEMNTTYSQTSLSVPQSTVTSLVSSQAGIPIMKTKIEPSVEIPSHEESIFMSDFIPETGDKTPEGIEKFGQMDRHFELPKASGFIPLHNDIDTNADDLATSHRIDQLKRSLNSEAETEGNESCPFSGNDAPTASMNGNSQTSCSETFSPREVASWVITNEDLHVTVENSDEDTTEVTKVLNHSNKPMALSQKRFINVINSDSESNDSFDSIDMHRFKKQKQMEKRVEPTPENRPCDIYPASANIAAPSHVDEHVNPQRSGKSLSSKDRGIANVPSASSLQQDGLCPKKYMRTKFIILQGDVCDKWVEVEKKAGFSTSQDINFVRYLLKMVEERQADEKTSECSKQMMIVTDHSGEDKNNNSMSVNGNCNNSSSRLDRNNNTEPVLKLSKNSVSTEKIDKNLIPVKKRSTTSACVKESVAFVHRHKPVSAKKRRNHSASDDRNNNSSVVEGRLKQKDEPLIPKAGNADQEQVDDKKTVRPRSTRKAKQRHFLKRRHAEEKARSEGTHREPKKTKHNSSPGVYSSMPGELGEGKFNYLSKSVQKQMTWAVAVFRDWLRSKGEQATNFEYQGTGWLNAMLERFYGEAHSLDNSTYSANNLQNLRRFLSLYLEENPGSNCVNISIPLDHGFNSSNRALANIMKIQPMVSYLDNQPILHEDIERMYTSEALSDKDPESLLWKVWFDMTYHLCSGQFSENFLKSLQKHQLTLQSDVNGVFYTFTDDICLPPDETMGKMYATPDLPERCPVRTTTVYLSNLCENCDALFQCPNGRWEPGKTWYLPVAASFENLRTIMVKISFKAKLSRLYKTSNVFATAIQLKNRQ